MHVFGLETHTRGLLFFILHKHGGVHLKLIKHVTNSAVFSEECCMDNTVNHFDFHPRKCFKCVCACMGGWGFV